MQIDWPLNALIAAIIVLTSLGVDDRMNDELLQAQILDELVSEALNEQDEEILQESSNEQDGTVGI